LVYVVIHSHFNLGLMRYQTEAGGKGGGAESSRKGSKESRAVPAPDANAELQASIQKWKEQSNPKSNSEMYNRGENGGSGFPMGHSRGPVHTGHSMLMGSSGSSSQAVDEGLHINSRRPLDSTGCRELKIQRSFKPQGTTSRLSRFSNFVADGSSQLDFSRDRWPDQCTNTRYEQINEAEPSNHLLGRPDSPYKNNGQAPRKENKW
ncbi:UNVERIFIED_CONTAM: putative serine/threonine-protein kinase, partial [Sesamum latifolium]